MIKRLTATVMVLAMALVCLGGQCSAEQTYEMQPIESITQAGDYSIKMDMTDLQTERAIEDGWWYYYTDSAETPAPYYPWETADGMVTALNVCVNVTNLKLVATVIDGDEVYRG